MASETVSGGCPRFWSLSHQRYQFDSVLGLMSRLGVQTTSAGYNSVSNSLDCSGLIQPLHIDACGVPDLLVQRFVPNFVK